MCEKTIHNRELGRVQLANTIHLQCLNVMKIQKQPILCMFASFHQHAQA